MATALILAGSNVDRERNLPAALDALRRLPGLRVQAVSAIHDTPAIGPDGRPSGQPNFHNVALRVETELGYQQLRQRLREVEARLGRVRTEDKFAPRPIDLDIVWYAPDDGGPPVVDPDLARYAHVVLPLAEIAPDWQDPTTGHSLQELAARFRPTARPAG
ncbi:2-amino-4-hydroxy-6-hydroxymethyldihydropteridine diphosphokinase [Litorilinea aerophila]|uniref:2-amino-4-hydroxy-6-hydroxymethyldihydropteridine diphosphokinase n=1 Tax=Litorilinea aerophila TaxID=1204385 RepID=A0A540VD08_9CHLR|nr:2-amino-4-hydroxy-6-hydroxymethyldihydropteridine diphosphokinase [Litorilinea aerophila]MCC9077610.1 2-amino-4-hydroxy-6-hydroxymethyldihydropteridine diphosphokinase [Litorilinea aerophila]